MGVGGIGKEAQRESESKSPRLIPELASDSERVVQLFWNIRDLPYGWDFFMENVSDPAHVPVSHHGIMGSRYTDAKYYDLIRVREMSVEGGFSYATTPTPATIDEAIHDFQPPCLMRISSRFLIGLATAIARVHGRGERQDSGSGLNQTRSQIQGAGALWGFGRCTSPICEVTF